MSTFTENGKIRLEEFGIEDGQQNDWEEYDADDFVYFFSGMKRLGEEANYYSVHTYDWVDDEDVITGLAIALDVNCSEVYQGESQSTFLVDTSKIIPGKNYYEC